MFTQSPIILCGICPNHRQTMSHILVYFRILRILGIDVKLIKRSITAIFTRTISSTEYGTYLQILNRSQLRIYITGESGSLVLVISVCHHGTIRVTIRIVPIATASVIVRTIIQIIITIYRTQRGSGKCATQRIVIQVTYICTIIFLIYETHLFTHLQKVFDDLVV